MLSGGRRRTSDESEVESFYFRTYNSYLLQKPDLHSNYEILLDLYKRNPAAFSILSKNDLIRLKQVQEGIRNNRFLLLGSELTADNPDVYLGPSKTDKRHIEVCLDMIRNKNLLEPFIGPIDFINIEHPTQFGPIDILVKSFLTAYIIEVKTESADHSIIGQIMKYFVGLSLTLNQKWCDEIRIFTLCPGYERSALTLLHQTGAIPFVYSYKPFEIKKL